MGFFKRKDNAVLIPPVAGEGGSSSNNSDGQRRQDPYAQRQPGGGGGGGDPYAQRGGGKSDPYAQRSPPPAYPGGPGSHGGPGPGSQHSAPGMSGPGGSRSAGRYAAGARGANPYAQGPYAQQNPYGDEDAARNELLGGPPAPKPAPARQYGYEGREHEEDFDEDEEIEGIKQSMRETKMDSLASTRNALRLAREAEDTARGTIGRLADQSETLADTERYLDISKANSQRAEDKAAELKALNRSIFRPTIVWNKEGKRQAQEQKILNRHQMEREDRMKALQDVQETRRRLGEATDTRYGSQGPVAGKMAARAEARKRFQFDATASDDELEDELDENLDETLEITRRLKTLAGAMGDEVSRQNKRIGNITDKTDKLSYQVTANTERLKMIR